MGGWYRDLANRPPPPACVSLETLTAERVELCAHVPPAGLPIPKEVASFPVDDNIPGQEEIAKAVLQLRLHRAGGPSTMRAEHLRMWIYTATREEDFDPINRENVATIINAALRGVEHVTSCACQTVVVIPKGGGTDFRGIGRVEVLWKAITGIINRRILSYIQFHDTIHLLCTERRTRTINLTENLLQHLIIKYIL